MIAQMHFTKLLIELLVVCSSAHQCIENIRIETGLESLYFLHKAHMTIKQQNTCISITPKVFILCIMIVPGGKLELEFATCCSHIKGVHLLFCGVPQPNSGRHRQNTF